MLNLINPFANWPFVSGKTPPLATAIVVAVLASYHSFGQSAAASVSFDVASVKLVSSGEVPAAALAGRRRSGGRLSWVTTSRFLVLFAYDLPSWRVQGRDLDDSFYSLDATMDPSTTEDQVRLMLRSVLIDRFKLVTHRENREVQGYALVVGPKGPRMKDSSSSGREPRMPEYLKGKTDLDGRIFVTREGSGISALTGRGVTASQLADTLSDTLGTFVLDETALTGKYYFGFKFLKDTSAADADARTIFSALSQELGLKLDKRKAPVEVLVIDRIDKVPTGN